MTDDIVTRLREMCGCWTAVTYYQDKCDNCLAADEIERLREDRDRWRALAEYLCQNAPSMVIPEEIACHFPDPLLVLDESTN